VGFVPSGVLSVAGELGLLLGKRGSGTANEEGRGTSGDEVPRRGEEVGCGVEGFSCGFGEAACTDTDDDVAGWVPSDRTA
jgi:hypothetical protein